MYAFIILDEIIEDLEDGHPGKRMHAINRIVGMRNKKFKTNCFSDRYSKSTLAYLEYDRIVRRLYAGDIKEAIIMIRELQDDIGNPCYNYEYNGVNSDPAWWRFADWRIKSLHE